MEADRKKQDLLRIVTGAILVGVLMYAVISRMWACEDAYISFRYIRNFVEGNGLVYNLGERVEGFTHPLWLFAVTSISLVGLSIRGAALWLSLALTFGTALIVTFQDRDSKGHKIAFPLAMLLFATHSGFGDFSVSGLEFPLVALLLALLYVSYKQHGLLGKPLLHGSLLASLYLTRPELSLLGLSFYLIELVRAGLMLAHRRKKELSHWLGGMVKLTLPLLLFAGSYHLFRALYYGEFYPNTFYAKSGLGAYWSQGWVYLAHFWRYSPVLLGAVAFLILTLILSRSYRRGLFSDERRLVMIGQAALLTLYVTRLGGDFMAFRFLLPAMVILALTFNDLLNWLSDRRGLGIPVVVAGLSFTSFIAILPFSVPLRQGYIADERQYYDLYHPSYRVLFDEPVAHDWYILGLEARAFRDSTGYPIVIGTGNIGYYGWAAGSRVRIVDVYGLVDREVARNWGVVTQRGRPGHDIKLRIGMAIDKEVSFWETPSREWNQLMITRFGVIITLDPELLRHFPDKIVAARAFKAQLLSQDREEESVYQFISYLENKYGVRLEEL